MKKQRSSDIHLDQSYVDRLLIRGIVFSLIWIMGFGSLYSVYLGIKAHRMIARSGGELYGMGKVFWCYVVGGVGVLLLAIALLAAIVNK